MKNYITEQLKKHDLKVTPQRVVIIEAILKLANHPTAENIKEYISKEHPNIALGTVYQVLEVLCNKGIIKKVKTEEDIMRYDADLDKHFHLYNCDTNEIVDYKDNALINILEEYFKNNQIPGFNIKEINLQISGNFVN